LAKEQYKVRQTIQTAFELAKNIREIKKLFKRLLTLNPKCVDTQLLYALIYRYILRDEGTFQEIVTKIQQIKNSAKLEQSREPGVKFFDSDVYAMLVVNGDSKELGRIRQATSSSKFVFGYDQKELINAKINMLMPKPFDELHDQFLKRFMERGQS